MTDDLNRELLRRLDRIDTRLDKFHERIKTLEIEQIGRNAIVRFLKLVGTVLLLAITLKWGDIPKLVQNIMAMLHGGNGG